MIVINSRSDKSLLLKAISISLEKDFQLGEENMNMLRKQAAGIVTTPPEDFVPYLQEILLSDLVGRGLDLMMQAGLMQYLLPEVFRETFKTEDQIRHPEKNLYNHSKRVVEEINKIKKSFPLSLAGLLHDIGKVGENDYKILGDHVHQEKEKKHPKVGAKLAINICYRLGLNIEDIKKVNFLVKNHMKFNAGEELPQHKVLDLVKSPYFEDGVVLQRADAIAAEHPDRIKTDFWLQQAGRTNLI